MRVQHGRLFTFQRLCSMSGFILDTVRVPLLPHKIHANKVLSGGPVGRPIVLTCLPLRR